MSHGLCAVIKLSCLVRFLEKVRPVLCTLQYRAEKNVVITVSIDFLGRTPLAANRKMLPVIEESLACV